MPKQEQNKTKASRPMKPYDPPRPAPVDLDEKHESYLHECLSDKPIGRDNPFPAKSSYRRPNACVVLTSNVDGSALNIHHGLKYRLDNFSQNPAFTLLQTVANPDNANEPYACFIPIGSEKMEVVNKSVDETIKTFTVKYDTGELADLAQINANLSSMEVPPITADDLPNITEKCKKGIDAVSFRVKTSQTNHLTVISDKYGILPQHSPLRQILGDLRNGARLTILRFHNTALRDVADKVWRHRLDHVLKLGIYPSFLPFAYLSVPDPKDEKMIEKLGLECYLDGDLKIPNLPWMRIEEEEPLTDDDGNLVETDARYSSFPIRRYFTSIDDWRVHMTLLLLKDHYQQRKMLAKIFNSQTKHRVKCIKMKGQHGWHLYVSLGLSNLSLPRIPQGTRFEVKFCRDGDVAMTDPSAEESDDDYDYAFAAYSTDVKAKRSSFVLEYFPKRTAPWNNDNEFEAYLSMDMNIEPVKRQFKAFEKIATTGRTMITQILLGTNYDSDPLPARTPFAERISDLSPKEAKELLEMLKAAKLNGRQWQAFDSVLLGTLGASFLLGPPGTGKSYDISLISVFLNLLGVPVMAGAPSRAATKAMARKIVEQIKKLPGDAQKKLQLTIVPTRTESEQMAMEFLNQRDPTAKWSALEDECLRPYQLFAKSLEGIQENWVTTSPQEAKAKNQWLDNYHGMLDNRVTLGHTNWSYFWKQCWDHRGPVLNSSNMIISTVNNQGAFVGTATRFLERIERDGLAIIDEAGFDQEWDVAITLSFSPRHVLFVGDHFQLQPICPSEGVSEMGRQGSMSLFQRAAETQDPALFTMLQVTYRMPARLADLAGAISGYEGLCTQDASVHDQDPTWQRYSAWFEDSIFAGSRRERFERKWQSKKHEKEFDKLPKDARRLFVNLRGRSGRANGSMSTVNYANVWAIYTYVDLLLSKEPSLEDKITILVPFAAQLTEMRDLLKKTQWAHIRVRTIDSFQGSEDEIVLICLTPANDNDPASIGFLRNWDRLNVAITRAKQAIVLFGNLDQWRRRMAALQKTSKNFALMVMDIVDRGDIIDLYKIDEVHHRLPKTLDELLSGSVHFSMECPESQAGKIMGDLAAPIRDTNAAETLAPFEYKILADLDKKRQVAAAGRAAAEAVATYASPVVGMLAEKVEVI